MLAEAVTPALERPPHLHWLDQVHGNRWVYADGQWSDEPQADALWTDQPGTGLVIQSADCVPILLASRDSNRPCIGAAHGGWRGLLAGVIEHLVAAMPVAPSQLCAWVGPCISQTHFEVGEDVWRPVAKVSPSVIAEHPMDASKRLVDLPQLAQHQLRSCGVVSVTQSHLCSYASPDFYSHRQATHQQGSGAQTGRMASVVCITG
jgi:YfiH family protein